MDVSIHFNDQPRLVTITVNDAVLRHLHQHASAGVTCCLLKWTPSLFPRSSCQRIFSAGVMSRRLSPFSFFENGEMSEGQRGRARWSFSYLGKRIRPSQIVQMG